jgi:hypothetical protein
LVVLDLADDPVQGAVGEHEYLRLGHGSVFPFVERMSIFLQTPNHFPRVVRKGLHEVARYGQSERQTLPDRGSFEGLT